MRMQTIFMRKIPVFIFVLSLFFFFISGFFVQNVAIAEDRETILKVELEQITKEIEAQQIILQNKQKESASFERDIAILNAQITKAKLDIKARNITLERLSKDIGVKNETIKTLSERIDKSKESLTDLLQKTNEIDSYSLTEIMLTNQDFSDFFNDLDSYDVVKDSLHKTYLEVKDTKEKTEVEKQSLEQKQKAEVDAKQEIEARKRLIEKGEKEKKQLLSESRKQEKGYQVILNERKKRAAEIRSALFALRDTAAISFGVALEYANFAYAKTGVRPAYLLAILTQESNLGKNIGTCNRANDPPEKGWRVIMKPDRDHTPYLQITSELGLNPDTMPLSCPISGSWGGAMGPAQFIPSTWQGMKGKVSAAIGGSVANPWLPKDAFMASAIYLSELGASQGGYSAEREAALKYYSGSGWKKSKNAFYGDGVMSKARNIQENMIDPLKNF